MSTTTTSTNYETLSLKDQGLPTLEMPTEKQGFPLEDGWVPTDGPCKKIDIDYTLISKVCVNRRATKFCLKSFPHEYDQCLKSVQIGLCYKTCFVNITPCIYQVPLKVPSALQSNPLMAPPTPTPHESKSPNKQTYKPTIILFGILFCFTF